MRGKIELIGLLIAAAIFGAVGMNVMVDVSEEVQAAEPVIISAEGRTPEEAYQTFVAGLIAGVGYYRERAVMFDERVRTSQDDLDRIEVKVASLTLLGMDTASSKTIYTDRAADARQRERTVQDLYIEVIQSRSESDYSP